MADNPVVHIGENSPEKVAYDLMVDIARGEGIIFVGPTKNVTRDWIIRTYCQCLQAVRNPFDPNGAAAAFGG